MYPFTELNRVPDNTKGFHHKIEIKSYVFGLNREILIRLRSEVPIGRDKTQNVI